MTNIASKWVKKVPKPYMTDKERKALAGFLRGTLDPGLKPLEIPATQIPQEKSQD